MIMSLNVVAFLPGQLHSRRCGLDDGIVSWKIATMLLSKSSQGAKEPFAGQLLCSILALFPGQSVHAFLETSSRCRATAVPVLRSGWSCNLRRAASPKPRHAPSPDRRPQEPSCRTVHSTTPWPSGQNPEKQTSHHFRSFRWAALRPHSCSLHGFCLGSRHTIRKATRSHHPPRRPLILFSMCTSLCGSKNEIASLTTSDRRGGNPTKNGLRRTVEVLPSLGLVTMTFGIIRSHFVPSIIEWIAA